MIFQRMQNYIHRIGRTGRANKRKRIDACEKDILKGFRGKVAKRLLTTKVLWQIRGMIHEGAPHSVLGKSYGVKLKGYFITTTCP